MAKKTLAASRKFVKPSYAYLIEKKRDGGELNDEEIRYVADSILDGEIPESQLAAMAMAIFWQGMSAQETASFAEEMMLSGEVVDLSKVTKPKIGKYSTGGVGDKTSMVLPALSAACGVLMPVINGVDEEFLITSLDKMRAIPKMNLNLDLKAFGKVLRTVNCGIIAQPADIAPVDGIFYKLRTNTATIPSIPLITASVLARKFSEGSDALVVDVKWGNGSYMRDIEQAKQLARNITRVARVMKRRCVARVTDMNQPLGDAVGCALEVREAIELLKGRGPEDLKDLVLKLGMEVVRLAGVAGSTLSAQQSVMKQLSEGGAFEKFKEMVAAQGGDTSVLDDPELLPKAKYIKKLPAPKRGYVHTINAGMIARGVQILSELPSGEVDVATGVSEVRKIGTQVKQGEPLMMIHYNDEAKLEAALDHFKNAYRLAPKRPTPPEFFVERVA